MAPRLINQPPVELVRRWAITPTAYLGGRRNQPWLVRSGETEMVLHASPIDITYELEVQQHLHRDGWPIAQLIREPTWLADRTWCLLERLPGASLEDSPAERRQRGRLLAELHESTVQLTGLGQRVGFVLADTYASDPELDTAIRAYERMRPYEGHIMRWHLDWARAAFAQLDLEDAETAVLHGDFARWNLLFQDGRLSGVLDFEASHRNYRVADFVLSWRGDQDEVLAGYTQVHPLSELDSQLLVPVFWSWLFLGMKQHIGDILSGKAQPHGFEWQIKHLLKRTGQLAHRAPAYPGT
jgi:aminoglycoside phosphotransferase (APT) family kinase protein